jgi:hypothetical protein
MKLSRAGRRQKDSRKGAEAHQYPYGGLSCEFLPSSEARVQAILQAFRQLNKLSVLSGQHASQQTSQEGLTQKFDYLSQQWMMLQVTSTLLLPVGGRDLALSVSDVQSE